MSGWFTEVFVVSNRKEDKSSTSESFESKTMDLGPFFFFLPLVIVFKIYLPSIIYAFILCLWKFSFHQKKKKTLIAVDNVLILEMFKLRIR